MAGSFGGGELPFGERIALVGSLMQDLQCFIAAKTGSSPESCILSVQKPHSLKQYEDATNNYSKHDGIPTKAD